eukprot:1475169-Pleurochrysis_carterae.AAC.1
MSSNSCNIAMLCSTRHAPHHPRRSLPIILAAPLVLLPALLRYAPVHSDPFCADRILWPLRYLFRCPSGYCARMHQCFHVLFRQTQRHFVKRTPCHAPIRQTPRARIHPAATRLVEPPDRTKGARLGNPCFVNLMLFYRGRRVLPDVADLIPPFSGQIEEAGAVPMLHT